MSRMTGQDVIDFIKEHGMERKGFHALVRRGGWVWSTDIMSLDMSCPEDDCIFAVVDANDQRDTEGS